MSGTFSELGRAIAMRASAVDSGASEEVFSHGNYSPDFMDLPTLFSAFDNLPDVEALRSHAMSIGEASRNLVYETALDLYPSDGDDTLTGQPAFDAIGLVAGETSNWIGNAADSFDRAVAVPAGRILPNQFQAVRALRLALEAEASLWTTVENNVKGIGDAALNALDHVEDKGPIGVEFGMTVLGSIVAISAALAAPATAGATLGLTLVLWGAANSVKDGAQELGDGFKVTGDSPQEIVTSLREAITELKGQIRETEQKIADGLTQVTSNIAHPFLHFSPPNLVRDRNFSGHA